MMLKHILIIPDGNRRYADERDISYNVLYKYIAEEVTARIINHILIKRKIPELTIFGVSRNNVLERPKEQLKEILLAQTRAYGKWLKINLFEEAQIRFRFIGDLSLLPAFYKKKTTQVQKTTEKFKGPKCNILVAYDGRWEILNAIKKVQNKKTKLTLDNFYNFLELDSDIDLVIRTGCEKRFSEAPIFQAAYAELFFEDFYYPEFNEKRIDKIIEKFDKRERRFGK